MKKLYIILFALSFFLILSSLIIPSSHGFPITKRLLSKPDNWELRFNTADRKLFYLTEAENKNMLISFLHLHDNVMLFSTGGGYLAIAGIVTMILSFIGWRREIYIERNFAKH